MNVFYVIYRFQRLQINYKLGWWISFFNKKGITKIGGISPFIKMNTFTSIAIE